MNPADAQRKLERKKVRSLCRTPAHLKHTVDAQEIARNKTERKFIREAQQISSRPEDIKKQLQEMLDLEEAGPLNKTQRLHKKVLQEAYDHALKKKMVRDLGCIVRMAASILPMRFHVQEDEMKKKGGDAAPMRPEDSRCEGCDEC